MQEGRTNGDRFSDEKSEKAGRGRLEETEEIAPVTTESMNRRSDCAEVVGGRIICGT